MKIGKPHTSDQARVDDPRPSRAAPVLLHRRRRRVDRARPLGRQGRHARARRRNARRPARPLDERANCSSLEPVELFADTHRLTVAPAEVGFSPDVEPTLDDAVRRRTARQLLRAHVASDPRAVRGDGRRLGEQPRQESGEALVDDFATRDRHRRARSRHRGRGTTLVPVGAVPGRQLDQDAAIDTIIDGLESWPRRSMELPISVATGGRRSMTHGTPPRPRTNGSRAPITLTAPDGSRHFSVASELAKMIEAVPQQARSRLDARGPVLPRQRSRPRSATT